MNNRTRMVLWSTLLAGAAGYTVVLNPLVFGGGGNVESPVRLPASLLGATLATGPVLRVGGEPETRPSPEAESTHLALFVVTDQTCMGCADYAFVARELAARWPNIRVRFLGVGPDTTTLGEWFAKHRIDGLLDPDSTIITELGLAGTALPRMLLLDHRGLVLFEDARTTATTRSVRVTQLLQGVLSIGPPVGGR